MPDRDRGRRANRAASRAFQGRLAQMGAAAEVTAEREEAVKPGSGERTPSTVVVEETKPAKKAAKKAPAKKAAAKKTAKK